MADPRIGIVVLTHERPRELAGVLQRLQALPEQPRTVVVDNASRPGSVAAVAARFPGVETVRCERNLGAAGRNAGVARLATPYVAFCDDDTWWAPGALRRAADLLDAHAGIAALSARVLVGPDEREDPACSAMQGSTLACAGLPGPLLVAFMAGASVMRTAAYRAVGGYEPRLFLGAEEWLMALDFLARGWHIVYAHEVVTHHHPSPANRDAGRRRVMMARNRLWIAWMRLPLGGAGRMSLRLLAQAARQGLLRPVLRETVPGLPWALKTRQCVPATVGAMVEQVFRASD
jgi:GT2 family glycosyltransferase